MPCFFLDFLFSFAADKYYHQAHICSQLVWNHLGLLMFGLFFFVILSLEWWTLSLALEQGLISLKMKGVACRATGCKLPELQARKGKIFFSELTYHWGSKLNWVIGKCRNGCSASDRTYSNCSEEFGDVFKNILPISIYLCFSRWRVIDSFYLCIRGFHCRTTVYFSFTLYKLSAFTVSCGEQFKGTFCASPLLWFVLGPDICHLLGSVYSFHP